MPGSVQYPAIDIRYKVEAVQGIFNIRMPHVPHKIRKHGIHIFSFPQPAVHVGVDKVMAKSYARMLTPEPAWFIHCPRKKGRLKSIFASETAFLFVLCHFWTISVYLFFVCMSSAVEGQFIAGFVPLCFHSHWDFFLFLLYNAIFTSLFGCNLMDNL